MRSLSATTPILSDEALIARVARRVMPMIVLCWIVATIDRANIGFAKLQMTQRLHMSEATFGLGSSIFFLGYLAFEVPSALAAHGYGVRIWFARIMACWGAVTLMLAFTSSAAMFYVLRFALGAAEAGLYPAALYYLSLWFPQRAQPRASGLLTVGSALGNATGALIAGPFLDLNGRLHLAGWQWVFMVTGLLPFAAVVGVLLWVDDAPSRARFLTQDQRARLCAMVAQEREPSAPGSPLTVMRQGRVLGFAAIYTLIVVALYGVIYWTPTVVRGFGATGTQNGVLTAAPWLVTAVLLITVMGRFNRRSSVLAALAAFSWTGCGCFAISALAGSDVVRYLALVVGTPCISLSIACFWTFPIRMYQGGPNAVAIATITTLSSLGGLAAQNLMPALARIGGSASTALWAPSLCLAAIGTGTLIVLRAADTKTG